MTLDKTYFFSFLFGVNVCLGKVLCVGCDPCLAGKEKAYISLTLPWFHSFKSLMVIEVASKIAQNRPFTLGAFETTRMIPTTIENNKSGALSSLTCRTVLAWASSLSCFLSASAVVFSDSSIPITSSFLTTRTSERLSWRTSTFFVSSLETWAIVILLVSRSVKVKVPPETWKRKSTALGNFGKSTSQP